jgi:small nuclear ribonucleoprotein (snRNP)-like protein
MRRRPFTFSIARPAMLPADFLREAQYQNQPVYVALQNGNLYYAYLLDCDGAMNLSLASIHIFRGNEEIGQLRHAFVRGGSVKFVSFPDVIEQAVTKSRQEARAGAAPRHDDRRGGDDRRKGGRGRGGYRGGGGWRDAPW